MGNPNRTSSELKEQPQISTALVHTDVLVQIFLSHTNGKVVCKVLSFFLFSLFLHDNQQYLFIYLYIYAFSFV